MVVFIQFPSYFSNNSHSDSAASPLLCFSFSAMLQRPGKIGVADGGGLTSSVDVLSLYISGEYNLTSNS